MVNSSSPNRTQPRPGAHPSVFLKGKWLIAREAQRELIFTAWLAGEMLCFFSTTGKIRWHLGKRLEILWKFVCHQRVNQIIILDSLNTDTNTSVSGVFPTNCIQTDILKRLVKQKQSLFEHPTATCLFPQPWSPHIQHVPLRHQSAVFEGLC